VVFIPGWFDAVITAALCTERFDFVLTRLHSKEARSMQASVWVRETCGPHRCR